MDRGSSSDAQELYRERFRSARNNPRLIAGSAISGADVDCGLGRVADGLQGRSLNLRAHSPDGGHFSYHVQKNMMVGRVDSFRSDDGSEEVFVLSQLKVARGSFEGDQLGSIADLIDTLKNECSYRRAHRARNFVLLEGTEVSRG